MVTEKGLNLKRTVPFLLIGILIFVAYLNFFVGIPEIVAIIQNVDLFYYTLAVAVLFVMMLANSLAWQYFLRPLSVNVPLRKTFLISWIGVFVDLLVPVESISGDASKAYLMTKESGENAGKVVASVVSYRILSMIITLGSLIFSSFFLYVIQYELPAIVSFYILLIIVGTGIALFFIFLFMLKEPLMQKLIDAFLRFVAFVTRGRLNLTSLRTKATKTLTAFHDSIGILLKNPKSLVPPVFFAVTSWLLSVLVSYLVFVSIGPPVDFVLIMIVHSISVSIQSIPIGIPAEVGLVEIVMSTSYGLLGVESSVGAAATVLIRILWVWFRIVIGFVAVQRIGIKNLAKNLRQDLF